MIIEHFIERLKKTICNNRNLQDSEDVLRLAFSNEKVKFDAYGGCIITTYITGKEEDIYFLNAYGDEDSEEVTTFDQTGELKIIAFSFCVFYNNEVYCFDLKLEPKSVVLSNYKKVDGKISLAEIHTSRKRAFYHYRSENAVSLCGLIKKPSTTIYPHSEADNWVSSPRIYCKLISI